MIPGETLATGADNPCPDCGKLMELEVLFSGGGYYIGTQCNCGPYSRESVYIRKLEDAREILKDWNVAQFEYGRQ